MHQTKTGLDRLIEDKKFQDLVEGNIGLLCHSASLSSQWELAVIPLQKIFKTRLKKLFGPQHGFITDVQDNMVESKDFIHPYFKLPVYSLYSDIRVPTDHMLEGLDTIIIDLQELGTRIYTYSYTMTLLMQKCMEKNIKVIVLDRPNPIGGEKIEGNILDTDGYTSFVGLHPLPVRHGLTIGEIALMAQKYWNIKPRLEVIPMQGWERSMFYEDTKLPWVMPSPNLPTIEGCFPFVGTVIFEGTNISEGRGTTRSLEIIGHPKVEPFSLHKHIWARVEEAHLNQGVVLRPANFMPTFQKHAGKTCGGFQIHVTDRTTFKPWKLALLLCREMYYYLGDDFKWKDDPYEYEFDKNPFDIINGTDRIRNWIESNGTLEQLIEIENLGKDEFLKQKQEISLY